MNPQENVGDSLLSNRLVPVELPESDEELAAIKARALAQEDYLLAFYSADARYGAIMIQPILAPNLSQTIYRQLMQTILHWMIASPILMRLAATIVSILNLMKP